MHKRCLAPFMHGERWFATSPMWGAVNCHDPGHAESMAQRPPRWPGSSLREQSGQALPLVAVCIIVRMAAAGLVVDLGNAYRVHQQLQASADSAAAAGATN